MKKKLLAVLMVALACVCVWLAINATQNAALAWGGVVVFIILAIRFWKGDKKKSVPDKPTGRPAEDSPQQRKNAVHATESLSQSVPAAKQEGKAQPAKPIGNETVYILKEGKVYHRFYTCTYVYGHDYIKLTNGQAKQRGLQPCKKCYPYGD